MRNIKIHIAPLIEKYGIPSDRFLPGHTYPLSELMNELVRRRENEKER